MTFELTLVGECEVQLTHSAGRGTACAKPPRSRRLEGWALRFSGVSGGPRAFGWKGRAAKASTCLAAKDPTTRLAVDFMQLKRGAPEDFKQDSPRVGRRFRTTLLWDAGGWSHDGAPIGVEARPPFEESFEVEWTGPQNQSGKERAAKENASSVP